MYGICCVVPLDVWEQLMWQHRVVYLTSSSFFSVSSDQSAIGLLLPCLQWAHNDVQTSTEYVLLLLLPPHCYSSLPCLHRCHCWMSACLWSDLLHTHYHHGSGLSLSDIGLRPTDNYSTVQMYNILTGFLASSAQWATPTSHAYGCIIYQRIFSVTKEVQSTGNRSTIRAFTGNTSRLKKIQMQK